MPGREVTEAMSSISSVDVLDASTQSGLAILSISPKIRFFSSMSLECGFNNQIGLVEAVVA